jgi:RNA polymerase sigma factor (sigma-70 family)
MSRSSDDTTGMLGRHRDGDEKARGELIVHSFEPLRGLTRRMLRGFPVVRRWEQTDDILQNAQVRLNRALERCAPATSAHFWRLAASLIRWELIDLARHHSRPEGHAAKHHSDHGAPPDRPDPRSVRAGGREPGPRDKWDTVREQVEALPEELRALVGLIWYEGLTQTQAAAALGVSRSTLKRQRRNALTLLASALEAERTE